MQINPLVIDLSHWNTVTDFAEIRKAGIVGVIHKATEGVDWTDHVYAVRRLDAAAPGLMWGAFHFMRPADPVAQAKAFVAFAKPDARTLLAVDHEDAAVPLTDMIRFIEAVEDKAGRQVALYSGSLIKSQILTATRADIAFLAARRLWLAHYSASPTWPGAWRSPWLWQFTGDGQGPAPHTVPGITGNVDIDSYAGTAEQLAAEWAGAPIAPAA